MASNNFLHADPGVNLVPQATTNVSVPGDIDYSSDTGKFNFFGGGGSSPAVTENGVQTLTNKTLIAPVIATIVNTGTLTLPTSTDTLVGRATADTLTNKTIAAGSNTISGLTNANLSGSAGITGANIAANTVANSNLAQMASHTFKGNNTGSTANALDLTATQLTAELNNFVGDSGSGGTKGLVPAPAAGDAAAAKFLKADGTWTAATGQGVTTIGTIDSQTASTNGAVIVSTTSLVMQSASATRPGLVNNTTQTMSGAKTFSTSVATPSILDNGAGLTIQASSAQALTLLTNGAGRLTLRGSEGFDVQQLGSSPSSPPAGYNTGYFLTDNTFNYKTSGGVERQVDYVNRLAAPQVSTSCGSFSTSSGSYVAVTNLSVTVTSNVANEVWEIFCQSDGTGTPSYVGIGGGSSNSNTAQIGVFRNGVEIGTYEILNFQGTAGGFNYEPTSSIRFVDINPPTGSNVYTIQLAKSSGTGATATLTNAVLVAYQEKF